MKQLGFATKRKWLYLIVVTFVFSIFAFITVDAQENKPEEAESIGNKPEPEKSLGNKTDVQKSLSDAWSNKGVALGKLGRYQDALSAYDEAIKIDPKDAGAWYNKACMYSLLNKKEESLRDLAQAISFDTKYKDNAKTDEDFKWLWDDDDFKKIVQ